MQADPGNAIVLVRGGAIIPFAPAMDYVGQKPLDPLTLTIFPSGRSSFTLYEDDGATYAYESGAYARTEFSCMEKADGIRIEIGPCQGSYAGQPDGRNYILQVKGTMKPRSVKAEALPLLEHATESEWSRGEAGWFYEMENGERRTIHVRLPKLSKTAKLTLFFEGASPVRYYR
jgi:hypothetical protein